MTRCAPSPSPWSPWSPWLLAFALALAACCSEDDQDIAIERNESSKDGCIAICRGVDAYATYEDVGYELHGCDEDATADGREIVVCHFNRIDCRPGGPEG